MSRESGAAGDALLLRCDCLPFGWRAAACVLLKDFLCEGPTLAPVSRSSQLARSRRTSQPDAVSPVSCVSCECVRALHILRTFGVVVVVLHVRPSAAAVESCGKSHPRRTHLHLLPRVSFPSDHWCPRPSAITLSPPTLSRPSHLATLIAATV